MGELEPQYNRRPLKGLSEEDLEALRIELQRMSRENNRLYQVYLDELHYRYIERLGDAHSQL
jgi:hypothetical protein